MLERCWSEWENIFLKIITMFRLNCGSICCNYSNNSSMWLHFLHHEITVWRHRVTGNLSRKAKCFLTVIVSNRIWNNFISLHCVDTFDHPVNNLDLNSPPLWIQVVLDLPHGCVPNTVCMRSRGCKENQDICAIVYLSLGRYREFFLNI